MQKYLIRRLVLMIPTLLGVTFLVFIMLRSMPGDVTTTLLGDYGAASPELRQAILEDFGLNESVPVQYLKWLGETARLDFGTSFFSGRSVNSELADRLVVTTQLGVMALVINLALGIPIGILSAVRQNSWFDNAGRTLAISLLAAPNFWIALLLITMAGRYFKWGVPSTSYVGFFDDPIRNLKFTIVPALILGASGSGTIMRFTRTAMLEVMRQDYIRTAWSKGLRERVVVLRHALKNALIPVVTVIGLFIPGIIGGSVIIESIYSIPGVGRYYFTAIRQLDLPVVQAINLIAASVVVFSNLAVDMAYSFLNPRIRYS
ncbi:MAG: ABC transporter permease [Dehalococcoidia bacterium]